MLTDYREYSRGEGNSWTTWDDRVIQSTEMREEIRVSLSLGWVLVLLLPRSVVLGMPGP